MISASSQKEGSVDCRMPLVLLEGIQRVPVLHCMDPHVTSTYSTKMDSEDSQPNAFLQECHNWPGLACPLHP